MFILQEHEKALFHEEVKIMKKVIVFILSLVLFLTGCSNVECQQDAAQNETRIDNGTEVSTQAATPKVEGETSTRAPNTEEYANEVFRLLNKYRNENGLNELVWDDTLAEVAKIRAPELVHTWSHIRPDGTKYVDILDEINYPSPLVGENLGKLQTTPEEVMQMWKDSPGHNKNLLGDFNKVGISVYEEEKTGYLYWVQIFAK